AWQRDGECIEPEAKCASSGDADRLAAIREIAATLRRSCPLYHVGLIGLFDNTAVRFADVVRGVGPVHSATVEDFAVLQDVRVRAHLLLVPSNAMRRVTDARAEDLHVTAVRALYVEARAQLRPVVARVHARVDLGRR